jgi:hypothetical protein
VISILKMELEVIMHLFEQMTMQVSVNVSDQLVV